MPPSIPPSPLEEGTDFLPHFNESGLLPVVAIETQTKAVLMLAWMNEEALDRTLSSGIVHYFSRSRNALWKKGETSGQFQHVVRILVDCDQDALVIEVNVAGNGGACHTGRPSCFYREVHSDRTLKKIL